LVAFQTVNGRSEPPVSLAHLNSPASDNGLITPLAVPFSEQFFYGISDASMARSREHNPSEIETRSHSAIPNLPAAAHPRRSGHCWRGFEKRLTPMRSSKFPPPCNYESMQQPINNIRAAVPQLLSLLFVHPVHPQE
jgi:hypothetical protein